MRLLRNIVGEILVLTWLDRAHRDVVSVHPRDESVRSHVYVAIRDAFSAG